jgi:hypothetical protein
LLLLLFSRVFGNSGIRFFFKILAGEVWTLLLYRIAGLLQNWEIICPPEKDLKLIVKKIKEVPKMIFCLPEAGA